MDRLYKNFYFTNYENHQEWFSIFDDNGYIVTNKTIPPENDAMSLLKNTVKAIQDSDVCLFRCNLPWKTLSTTDYPEIMIAIGAGKKVYILDEKIPFTVGGNPEYIFPRYGKVVGYPGVVFIRDISVFLEKIEKIMK